MIHRKRRVARAVIVLSLGLALAACAHHVSGPSVASLDTSATPTATPSVSGSVGLLAYSACMRSHGVPDFPDPDAEGRLTLQAHPGSDLDPDSSTFQAAQKACESLRPAPNASGAVNRADLLKFSQCMRSHGVPDFPDPTGDGGIQIRSKPGSDLDPNSPAFQAAQKACASTEPGGGEGPTTDSNPGGAP